MIRSKKFICRITLITVITASALALFSCAKKNEVVTYETQENAGYTLSFFGNKYEPENVEVIEDILTGFMDENPDVVVAYESLKGADYYHALENREASANLDDVFMINHDTILNFLDHGSLADLSALAADVPFSESMLSQMKSEDGHIYWVPTTVSAFGLYCNLDLLEEHQQPIPGTLGEWESVCDYFVSQGITPIIANNDISLKTLAIAKGFYPLYAEKRQTEVFEKLNSGEEQLSTYLSDGFALAEEFCKKGYINASKALNTKKTSDDLAEFAQGNSPFMLTGVWAARRVQGMAPELSFRIIPYPVLEDGTVLVINPDVRLSVSAKGDNQETAKKFITYFLQEDNIGRFADNQVSFSPLRSEYTPSLREIQDIASSYYTQTPVIGSDSHILFPIWDITANTAKGILAGGELRTLMEQMDEEVRKSND